MQFLASTVKNRNFYNRYFNIVTTHNDKISHVKHGMARFARATGL